MAIRFIFEHDVVVDERPRRTFTLLPGKGVKGDKGDPGNGLTVKDVFDTLAELEAAYPTGNEYAYQVIDEDREIFIWSANDGAWTSLGALEGPAGPQGKGISSYVEYYARSTSGTTAPADADFSTTPPELTSTYKYMWSYALITLTDSTTITTSKHVVGAYGDTGDTGETGATGATGKGISSYVEYYARGTSATTAPADADFSTTPPELTSTYKFMWAYTVITYSDNTSLTTAKHLIGVYGDKGDTGASGADGADGVGVPSGGTTGQVLKKKSSTNYDTEWVNESGGGTWGSITGTLSDQTDLQNALDAKAPVSTTYTKTDVDSKITAVTCLIVNCGTISSLPATISNSSVTSDMVAVKAEFGTPDAQLSDWTVTTSTGSVTISGTLISSGSTTLKLYLVKSR